MQCNAMKCSAMQCLASCCETGFRLGFFRFCDSTNYYYTPDWTLLWIHSVIFNKPSGTSAISLDLPSHPLVDAPARSIGATASCTSLTAHARRGLTRIGMEGIPYPFLHSTTMYIVEFRNGYPPSQFVFPS